MNNTSEKKTNRTQCFIMPDKKISRSTEKRRYQTYNTTFPSEATPIAFRMFTSPNSQHPPIDKSLPALKSNKNLQNEIPIGIQGAPLHAIGPDTQGRVQRLIDDILEP
jgi:hypothetical protein